MVIALSVLRIEQAYAVRLKIVNKNAIRAIFVCILQNSAQGRHVTKFFQCCLDKNILISVFYP